jgi:hypothetical protein
MAGKYIYRKRYIKILVYEFLIASIVIAVLTVVSSKIHPAIGLLIFIGVAALLIYLFVESRIFRYIFSILFSLAWASGAYLVGKNIDKKSIITSIVFIVITLCVSIWAHWDNFQFYKDAKVIEYDR